MGVIGLICLICTSQALANDRPPVPTQAPPSTGIWPTDTLLENIVRRTTRDAATRYQLSPQQHQKMEAFMLGRWPKFLTQNRSRLQPLIDRYFESQFSPSPPSPEQVQSFAQQALPIFQEIRQQLEAGNREIREVMTPDQRASFDADAAKIKLGLELFNQKMTGWATGNYQEGDLWNPPDGWKPNTPSPAPDPVQNPSAPIDAEMLAWDRFVHDFIQTFNLDPGQQQAALSFLAEAKQKAQAHRDRHRQDIEQLEHTIQAHRPQDQALVNAELQRLYSPIDALFKELQRRLETLPTQAQTQNKNQSPERQRREQ